MRAIALVAFLASGPAYADWTPAKPSTDPNPVVKIEGDTLTYIGRINEAGLTALGNAVRDLPRGQVTKMLVNSGGGDTKPGIYIGSIISDLKPALTIEVGCFSRWRHVPVGLIPPLSRTGISRGLFAIWIVPGAQVKHRLPRWARSRSASLGPPKALTRERTRE
jgi:hypothetical protein